MVRSRGASSRMAFSFSLILFLLAMPSRFVDLLPQFLRCCVLLVVSGVIMGRRGCAWGKISKDTYVYVCRSEASAHVKVYMQVRWGVVIVPGLWQ